MLRDIRLKPRTTEDLPVEKLKELLNRIYPEEQTAEIMENLGYENKEESNE